MKEKPINKAKEKNPHWNNGVIINFSARNKFQALKNLLHNTNKWSTQVSSLKYPGILLFFFVGGGEIVREGGYY